MHVCLHAWVDLGENGSRGSSGQGSRGQRANDGDKDGASTGDEGKGSGWGGQEWWRGKSRMVEGEVKNGGGFIAPIGG